MGLAAVAAQVQIGWCENCRGPLDREYFVDRSGAEDDAYYCWTCIHLELKEW